MIPKKIFLLMVTAILFQSGPYTRIMAQEKGFILSGTLKGAEGIKIYLVSYGDRRKDSSIVKSDGTFIFTGSVPEPKVCYIYGNGIPKSKRIIIENTNISLTGNVSNFDAAVVTGSSEQALYEQMSAFSKWVPDLGYMADLYQKKEAFIRNKDTAALRAVQNLLDDNKRKGEETDEKLFQFIKKHPDAYACAYMVYEKSIGMSQINLTEKQVARFYGILGEKARESYYGKLVGTVLEKRRPFFTGQTIPDLLLTDVSGKEWPLSYFRGKYILLELWTGEPGYSPKNAILKELHAKYKDKNFDIVWMTLPSLYVPFNKEAWINTLVQEGITSNQFVDTKKYQQQYGLNAYTSLLISPSGTILLNTGGEALLQKLADIFK
jgi:hypothetical protein